MSTKEYDRDDIPELCELTCETRKERWQGAMII